jgi:hypothetical protein
LITVIHLLIFIFLSIFLISFPFISVPKKKGSGFLTNFQLAKKVNFFKLQNVVPSLIYIMNLFEYMFQNSFGVHFFWTSSFISWILGCCFWVLQADFVSLSFILISIIFCLLAIFDISDLNLHGFSNFRRAKLGFSVYVLIISISVLAMVAFNSLAVGFTTNILLLLFVYNWRVFEKTNEKQL